MTSYQPTRWSLTDLLQAPGGAALENALAEIEKRTRDLEAARSSLTPDISEPDLISLLRDYEAMVAKAMHAFATDPDYLIKMADNARRAGLGLPPLPFAKYWKRGMPVGPYTWWGPSACR